MSHPTHAIPLPTEKAHAATLSVRPHRNVSRLQRWSRLAIIAAQGCRLGLPSAAHVSPAGAAVYQFSGSLPMTAESA